MKKAIAILLVVFILIANKTTAQTILTLKLQKSIVGNYSNFTVDNLGNLYLITNQNQLKKINNQGDSVAVFNDVKRYGNPTLIDVTNPLKILLYYKPFATIVILDRFLNVRNTINCRQQGIFLSTAIAQAFDNSIWLFDEQDFKLKKINDAGEVKQETVDCRILLDETPQPSKIITTNNYLYLYDEEKGFYIFDYYGAFKNKLSFLNWQYVQVNENILYGFSNNKLYTYLLNSFTLKEYSINQSLKNYSDIKLMGNKMYALQNDCLDIYQVK
jgi:hypothetical protein